MSNRAEPDAGAHETSAWWPVYMLPLWVCTGMVLMLPLLGMLHGWLGHHGGIPYFPLWTVALVSVAGLFLCPQLRQAFNPFNSLVLTALAVSVLLVAVEAFQNAWLGGGGGHASNVYRVFSALVQGLWFGAAFGAGVAARDKGLYGVILLGPLFMLTVTQWILPLGLIVLRVPEHAPEFQSFTDVHEKAVHFVWAIALAWMLVLLVLIRKLDKEAEAD